MFAETEGGELLEAIGEVPVSYVADGHHRSASAARVGKRTPRSEPQSHRSGKLQLVPRGSFPREPAQGAPLQPRCKRSQRTFRRRISPAISENFRLDSNGKQNPEYSESLCVYLDGKWHTLLWDEVDSDSPIDRLDVSVLQDRILSPILGIGDPRTDERIDFIGGIRGTGRARKTRRQWRWAVAFSMYPTTVQQLIDIADANEIMPPKSTWFEPKRRSGLFVYTLND